MTATATLPTPSVLRRPRGRRPQTTVLDLGALFGLDTPARGMVTCFDVPAGGTAATRARLHDLDRPAVLLDGVLLHTVRLGRRESAELRSTGDVLPAAAEQPEPFASSFRALTRCRLGVLSDDALATIATAPGLLSRIVGRLDRHADVLAVQSVLVQFVSIEERLQSLFPLLAERWGTVTPEGVVLPGYLTHSVLAALVGARRPSLTTALVDLVERGVVTRLPDRRWLLTPALAGVGPH